MPGGDKETNRYTDAVVSNIKEKLNVDFDYSIFGGSNYADFFQVVKQNEIHYPIIRIDTVANFTFGCTEYLIKRPNGRVEKMDHDFVHTLPYAYGIKLRIFYDEETEPKAAIIENQIRSSYAIDTGVWVDVPNFKDNKSMVKLRVDPNEPEPEPLQNRIMEALRQQNKTKLEKDIPFVQFYSVYYYQGWDTETLNKDPKQQFAVLQIAEFSSLTYSKLLSALDVVKLDYRPFVMHEKNRITSFFSPSYRQIKNLYDSKRPITRAQFDAAFKNIVSVFPQLYNFFVNGASYDEICNIIKGRAEELFQRYADACNDLNLPERVTGENGVSFSCREPADLTSLLEAMVGRHTLLETVIKDKLGSLEAQREFEMMEASFIDEREPDYSEYAGNNASSSGSGGFLREVASTAAGVYIGERLVDRKRAKDASNKKPDLWGTAACPYGEPMNKYDKHAPDFAHIRCNIGCPKWGMCSHWNTN
ncbi:MAG: hypothetical protein J5890_05335 [Clostridia bacterium]|nr:hypothetical protein [Clostridia bacterium]